MPELGRNLLYGVGVVPSESGVRRPGPGVPQWRRPFSAQLRELSLHRSSGGYGAAGLDAVHLCHAMTQYL